jgi:hypothetical protein
MPFKYQNFISLIANCPPADYYPTQIKAYRFVFSDPNHPDNFLPVLMMNPKRNFPDPNGQCLGYALSLFDSLENAQKRYGDMVKGRPALRKKLGSHIAAGIITPNDGLVSEVNSSGHFSLHQFAETDLKHKFQIISEA